jgi:anaerobic selenocysteine-containing dehydrogenase
VSSTSLPWRWEEDGMTVTRSVARTAPGCHEGCGVRLYVKDGVLVKVEGDHDFPLSMGRLCPRCLALKEVVYHPDRLTYPVKRAGERGEGKWQRISWDEAFDTIARKFNEYKTLYGPESIFFCHGTGRDIYPYYDMLAESLGTPNNVCFGPLNGNACFLPKVAVTGALFGGFTVADCAQSYPERYDHPEWKVPECVVIWGNQPTVSSPDSMLGHWIVDCIKRGSKLIVIDPRRTWEAAHASIWMQVRPGTDAALALAMLNVIINEKLYDEEFVRNWTHGFDQLKKRVQEYPPNKVAVITGVPEEQIVVAARVYAASKPAAVQWGVGLDQSIECVSSLQAIGALWSITGNMDVPGGNIIRGDVFKMSLANPARDTDPLVKHKNRIGIGKYPFLDWAGQIPGESLIDQMESGKPYALKASWLQGTNTFVNSTADARRTYEAFRKLNFNVLVDLFITPTAMAFADIVLPAATYPERDGLYTPVGGVNCTATINKAIEPIGECKSDMEINLELGRRLNPEAWPWKDVQEMFTYLLRYSGVTFTELRDMGFLFDKFEYRKYEKGLLRPDGKPGFDTPTGKVELYSTVFKDCGLDPLPYHQEPPESPVSTPELAKKYPLILTTGGRTPASFASEHRQVPSLRKMNPDPLLDIHPDTAAGLGIKNGDWIYIENSHGKCRQRARLSDAVKPGVVHAQYGWWFPEKKGTEPDLFGVWDSNINQLLPSGWTGKSGLGYPFKSQICRVYKAEAPGNA